MLTQTQSLMPSCATPAMLTGQRFYLKLQATWLRTGHCHSLPTPQALPHTQGRHLCSQSFLRLARWPEMRRPLLPPSGIENPDPDYNLGCWPCPTPPPSPSLLPQFPGFAPSSQPAAEAPAELLAKQPRDNEALPLENPAEDTALRPGNQPMPWALHWKGSRFSPALVAPLLLVGQGVLQAKQTCPHGVCAPHPPVRRPLVSPPKWLRPSFQGRMVLLVRSPQT